MVLGNRLSLSVYLADDSRRKLYGIVASHNMVFVVIVLESQA